MPARLALTPEQRLARQRAQAVARNRRYRERLREHSVSRSREQAPSSTRARDVRSPGISLKELTTTPKYRPVDRRKGRLEQIFGLYGWTDAGD